MGSVCVVSQTSVRDMRKQCVGQMDACTLVIVNFIVLPVYLVSIYALTRRSIVW